MGGAAGPQPPRYFVLVGHSGDVENDAGDVDGLV